MQMGEQSQVNMAWDHATKAIEATLATREHCVVERQAWLRWWHRWQELESEGPGQRTLVVCATCVRYRDSQGRWEPMPSGLSELLAGARSLCVSHGLCPSCSTRALDAVKVRPPPAARAHSTRD